jgi:hypothetical protein
MREGQLLQQQVGVDRRGKIPGTGKWVGEGELCV